MNKGITRLIWAYDYPSDDVIERKHPDIVKILADNYFYGDVTLFLAAEKGHLEAVRYWVSVGADISASDYFALHLAAKNGHLEVVKYLVSVGADIHVNNDSVLRWAAMNGRLEVVMYLVSAGANVYTFDIEALYWTAKSDRLYEMAEFLISKRFTKTHTQL